MVEYCRHRSEPHGPCALARKPCRATAKIKQIVATACRTDHAHAESQSTQDEATCAKSPTAIEAENCRRPAPAITRQRRIRHPSRPMDPCCGREMDSEDASHQDLECIAGIIDYLFEMITGIFVGHVVFRCFKAEPANRPNRGLDHPRQTTQSPNHRRSTGNPQLHCNVTCASPLLALSALSPDTATDVTRRMSERTFDGSTGTRAPPPANLGSKALLSFKPKRKTPE